MGQVLSLEDFADQNATGPFVAMQAPGTDPQGAGFDQGYQAGWDDAVSQTSDQDMQARANCATALQELDFTYFEARQHVAASFKPLVEAVVGAVLPEAARHALLPLIAAELDKVTGTIDTPIEILCSPQAEAQLTALVNEYAKGPVSVRKEDTLAASQVLLHFDDGVTEIDVDQAVTSIRSAVEAYFTPEPEDMRDYG